MFHFLHLQENLVYVTCKEAISADLIYFIARGDSVYIRSIYQLENNTLLVDLNVPTGELEYNLTSALIEACNKYFYDYKGDRFILDAYLANSYLEEPRIIQDNPFILWKAICQKEAHYWVINYYSMFIILLLWKAYSIHLYNYWVITNSINGKLYLSLYLYLN